MERAGAVPAVLPEEYRMAFYVSKRRLRDVLANDSDGVLILRRDGVVRALNSSAGRLLGRPARDLIGQDFGFPEDVERPALVEIRQPSGRVRLVGMHAVEMEWEGEAASRATLHYVTQQRRLTHWV